MPAAMKADSNLAFNLRVQITLRRLVQQLCFPSNEQDELPEASERSFLMQ